MSERWMVVYEDMTWYEVDLSCAPDTCEVFIYKDKKKVKCKKNQRE